MARTIIKKFVNPKYVKVVFTSFHCKQLPVTATSFKWLPFDERLILNDNVNF